MRGKEVPGRSGNVITDVDAYQTGIANRSRNARWLIVAASVVGLLVANYVVAPQLVLAWARGLVILAVIGVFVAFFYAILGRGDWDVQMVEGRQVEGCRVFRLVFMTRKTARETLYFC